MRHHGRGPTTHIRAPPHKRERVRVMEIYQPTGWSHIHWYTETVTTLLEIMYTVFTMVLVGLVEVGAKGP